MKIIFNQFGNNTNRLQQLIGGKVWIKFGKNPSEGFTMLDIAACCDSIGVVDAISEYLPMDMLQNIAVFDIGEQRNTIFHKVAMFAQYTKFCDKLVELLERTANMLNKLSSMVVLDGRSYKSLLKRKNGEGKSAYSLSQDYEDTFPEFSEGFRDVLEDSKTRKTHIVKFKRKVVVKEEDSFNVLALLDQ